MLVVKDRTGVMVDHAVDARIIANGRRHYGYVNIDVDQISAGWVVSWDKKKESKSDYCYDCGSPTVWCLCEEGHS